jgi:nucleoside permease NupC
MGVPAEDCLVAGKLIGLKTFINEFVAYEELGKIINFRKEIILNNTMEFYRNGSMVLPGSQSMLWNVG